MDMNSGGIYGYVQRRDIWICREVIHGYEQWRYIWICREEGYMDMHRGGIN